MYTLTVLMGLAVTAGALAAVYRTFGRYPVDVVGIFCGYFALVFLVRAAGVHLFGLSPSPAFLPDFRGDTGLFALTHLLVFEMLLGVFVGLALSARGTVLRKIIPHVPHQDDTKVILTATAVFWAASLVAVVVIIATVPSITQMMRYVRIDKGLGVAGRLTEILPSTMYFTSAFVLLMYQRRQNMLMYGGLVLFVFFGAFIALMGSRNSVVLPIVALLGGFWLYGGDWRLAMRQGRLPKKSTAVLAMAGLLPALLLFFLANLRQTLTRNIETRTYTGLDAQNLMISVNLHIYDAFTSIVKMVDGGLPLRYGQDMWLALVSVIPRWAWPGKPEVINTGVEVARIFEPTRIMGLPISGPGEWFYNFGLLGPLVCGILTGLILGALRDRYRDYLINPFSLVLGVQFISDMIQFGVSNISPRRYVLIVIPVVAFALLLRLLRGSTAPNRSHSWQSA